MAQTLPESILERAVERYEKAIASLEAAAEDLSVEHVLDVLIARDAVQVAMSDKTQHHSGRLIKAVKELDNRLKEQARYINRVTRLAEWQAIFNPPEKEWWWLLDPITPKPWRDRYDWLWRFFSLVFLTASLSLLIDISTRFLSGGPDTAGVFAIIIPSVLTLLAGGGALTKTGQEGIEHILTSLQLKKDLWDEIVGLASFLLCLVLIAFYCLMPWFAEQYINLGDLAYCEQNSAKVTLVQSNNCVPQLARAENQYNRAIKLDPDNAKAHYKLGKIYQELQDFDNAVVQYKMAAKSNITEAYDALTSLYLARQDYGNADRWLRKAVSPMNYYKKKYTISNEQYQMLQSLSRAYLEQKKYSEAITWLTLGLKATENDPEKQYNMLNLLGWVRLKQNRPEAIEFLERATKLDQEKAAAHCLLAQALEQQQDTKRAKLEWEQCVEHASQDNPDEDRWSGLARQRLKVLGNKP